MSCREREGRQKLPLLNLTTSRLASPVVFFVPLLSRSPHTSPYLAASTNNATVEQPPTMDNRWVDRHAVQNFLWIWIGVSAAVMAALVLARARVARVEGVPFLEAMGRNGAAMVAATVRISISFAPCFHFVQRQTTTFAVASCYSSRGRWPCIWVTSPITACSEVSRLAEWAGRGWQQCHLPALVQENHAPGLITRCLALAGIGLLGWQASVEAWRPCSVDWLFLPDLTASVLSFMAAGKLPTLINLCSSRMLYTA